MTRPWLVFSSSSGETFKALWGALRPETRKGLRAFLTDRPCPGLEVARQIVPQNVYQAEHTRPDFEKKTLDWIEKNPQPDAMILLCGFFGILSGNFLKRCPYPVVNTHPSLLPSFPGLDKGVHRKAFESVTVSGFSVHLVTEALDGGPVLFQHPVWMDAVWTQEHAREQVRATEQKWLPRIWERILESEITKSDSELTSRELRRSRDLNLKSFADEETPEGVH